MWPAVKKGFNQNGFQNYVKETTWPSWRPDMIVWHNTAAPSLTQWIKSAEQDKAKGLQPGMTRIISLENFFRANQGWSGCPHLFIAPDFIWVMNPLNFPGVHSPSWNSRSIGIEMIGDFSVEDDETGNGLKVKQNTIFATAMLCEAININPNNIMLHKEDPRTTHDCPGKNIAQDKREMIMDVRGLMAGGEHDPDGVGKVISGEHPGIPEVKRVVLTTIKDLNLRTGPGVTNPSKGMLPINLPLEVFGEQSNGTDKWLRVTTPAGVTGWVSGRYTKEK